MALIKEVRGFRPSYGANCYFSENATIIGDVVMGDDFSLKVNWGLRGDVNSIRIGNKVNIQDGAILHTTYQKSIIEIGDQVSIAHHAIVHGAKICSNVLIGMGAIVMDHAVIGEYSIIASGAVVAANTIVEPGSIYGGIPARKLKSIEKKHSREIIERIANNYLMYAGWYK